MIHQEAIKVVPVVVSIFFLYWITSFAYNQVKKPAQIENLPLIMKSPCSINYFINKKELDMTDLSLYYSGIKEEKVPDNSLKNKLAEEDKIQEKLLEMVKEEAKDVKSEQKEEAIQLPRDKLVEVKKTKKPTIKSQNDKKKNDAFSKKKSTIFDLIEE